MIFIKIFLIFCIYSVHSSSSVTNIIFTVKNLSTNDRLKSNFHTMISSLFEHTSKEYLNLYVIGDIDSHRYVDQTLKQLDYHLPVMNIFFSNE